MGRGDGAVDSIIAGNGGRQVVIETERERGREGEERGRAEDNGR